MLNNDIVRRTGDIKGRANMKQFITIGRENGGLRFAFKMAAALKNNRNISLSIRYKHYRINVYCFFSLF